MVMQASTISVRLCGGMLVAMPTAIPLEPFTSRLGMRVGSTTGSTVVSSKLATKSTVSLSMSASNSSAMSRHARFGVPVSRRRIAVDRAEVALPVNQRVAQRKRLRHAHHRVVHRGVAVRMILAEHLADHLGALHVLAVVQQAHVVHRVQNAAVHRLQAVAHVGQRAADDDRHRIVEIRTPHLVFNVDGLHVAAPGPLLGRAVVAGLDRQPFLAFSRQLSAFSLSLPRIHTAIQTVGGSRGVLFGGARTASTFRTRSPPNYCQSMEF